LKTGGTDTTKCITYSSPCGTLDHVMRNIVNTTVDCVIYIDSGTYDYTIICESNIHSSYFNRTFSVNGYISGPFVNANDINTYPIILFDVNSGHPGIFFYTNVSAFFQYVKFYLGINSNAGRRVIRSLFN
jgi:hypothetical protein